MKKSKPTRRILALMLSIVMVLGMAPMTVAAESPPVGEVDEIIAFEALSEKAKNREAALGTSLADLTLPDTLTATVLVAVQDSGGPEGGGPEGGDPDDDAPDNREPVTEEITIPVPVTWQAEPEYDGETAGTYTFTAEVEGYTVSAALPQITVTVREEAPPAGGEITAFDPLDEDISQQAVPVGTPLSGLVLPESLAATVEDEAVSVPVTWNAEPEYSPGSEDEESGNYLFTAELGEGYTLADGVSAPTIMVSTFAALGWGLLSAGAPVDITGKTVAQIKTAIEAALALADVTSVTVTGSQTGVDSTLTLNIPAGKTVVWAATFKSASAFTGNLISLPDDGAFEVTTGGMVSATGNYAIYASGASSAVTVSGTGKVEVTAESGCAIRTSGSVEVTGGTVSATNGYAIYASGASSAVTVSGTGKVEATAESGYAIHTAGSVEVKDNAEVSATGNFGRAIYASGASSTVTVSGGLVTGAGTNVNYPVIYMSNTSNTGKNVTVSDTGKVEATADGGYTIRTTGSVEVSGGMVSATGTTGYAIYAAGAISTVTVSGTGKVEATAASGYAIRTVGSVEVKNNAEVSATGNSGKAIDVSGASSTVTVSGTGKVEATATSGYAIRTSGSVEVKDNAEVSATGKYGYAIYAYGASSTVTVSGGVVTGADTGANYPVIYMSHTSNTGLNVTVSGTGKVEATANSDYVIRTSGSVEVTGGTVSATTGIAIYANGASSTVTVSGGVVFAYRSAVTGSNGVIYLPNNSSGFTNATDTGVVIAWNAAANNRIYQLRGAQDIATSPTDAAYWYNSATTGGIAYKNGANEGFIPLTGVTVTKITLTAADLTYTDLTTLNYTYNGSPQGIGAVTLKSPHNSAFNGTTGGTLAVHYNGSTTVPTDADTYAVTVEISGGTEYEAVASIPLGSYTVAPKPVIVTPTSGQSKKFGATDPVLTFTNNGGLDTMAFTGVLYRTANENVGSYPINLGTLSAGANYSLSLAAGTFNFTIEQAKVQSIDTAVENVAMSAYDVRNAVDATAVIASAGLPASVSVTTDGGTATLPITWNTLTAYNAKGADYAVTGTLTGNANIGANNVTKSVTITVTPVTAPKPPLGDTLAVTNNDASATAAELGITILPTSGAVTVEGERISYVIDWNGGQTLDRTNVGDSETFTGVISYPGAPSWLSIPADLSVSRKVTVTAKTPVTIGGVTTPDRTYSGAPYVPGGTVTASDGFPVGQLVWLYESTDGGAYSSSTAPTNAGAYKLTISVPESDPNYIGSETFTFTITKREITLTADNKAVIKGGILPTLTYTIGNLAPNETASDALNAEPTLYCPTFDGNALGNYPITLSGGTAAGNYTIIDRTGGTLTVAEQTYTVTFDLGGGTRTGGGALTQIVAEGGAAVAPTVTRSGYTFSKWDKAFDNVASDLTVMAIWSYNGGGSDPTPTYTPRTLSDPTTGVTVSGGLTADAVVKVVQNGLHSQGTCAACDEMRSTADARGGFIALHDIGLTSGGYSGNLTISIPVGTEYNGQTVDILHCKLNQVETLTGMVQNGVATFTVSSLSPFAVLKPAPVVIDTPDDAVEVPQTGDNSNMGLWVMMLVISLLVCGFAVVQLVRKRRAHSCR